MRYEEEERLQEEERRRYEERRRQRRRHLRRQRRIWIALAVSLPVLAAVLVFGIVHWVRGR